MRSFIAFWCLAVMVSVAIADPIMVSTERKDAQDDWELNGWVEELSCVAHNPEQSICPDFIAETDIIPCPADYLNNGNPNVIIAITNMTDRYFSDLYYVGDVNEDNTYQTTFTNYDECVADITPVHNMNAPGLAFKIDRFGENQPLIFESILNDNIFAPGETWHFIIQEYSNTSGIAAYKLGSAGPPPYGAIAQASSMNIASSGSIITPEPSTIFILSLGLGTIMLRKKK